MLTASDPSPGASPVRVANLKPRITLSEPKNTPRAIIRSVAQKHDLTMDEMFSTSRRRPIAWARQEAFDRLYRETRLSLPAIARLFDKDHTTVLYGIWEYRKRKAAGKVA